MEQRRKIGLAILTALCLLSFLAGIASGVAWERGTEREAERAEVSVKLDEITHVLLIHAKAPGH